MPPSPSVFIIAVIVVISLWVCYMIGRKHGYEDGWKYGQSQGFNLGYRINTHDIKSVKGKVLVEVPNDQRGELFDIEDNLNDLGVVFDAGAGTKQVERGEPRFVREWFIDGVNQQNIRFETTEVETFED